MLDSSTHRPSTSTQLKVNAALQLFASLRESNSGGSPTFSSPILAAAPSTSGPYQHRPPQQQQPTPLQERANAAADAAIASYNSGGADGPAVYFGTASEKQLKAMSSRELIQKLATNEAILKRLYEKNRYLTQQLADRQGNSGGGGGGGSSLPQQQSETVTRLKQELRDANAAHRREMEEKQEKQLRLATLLTELEDKIQRLESQQQAGGVVAGSSGTQRPAAPLSPLSPSSPPQQEHIHRLEIEKEVLSSHLLAAEKRNRQLEEELRSGGGGGSGTARPPRHPEEQPGGTKRAPAPSQYNSVLQDALTTLQFRLHQSQAERTRLQTVQLDALLKNEETSVPRINSEVKKLFSVMRQLMVSEQVDHQAQRERMNEDLYALEKEIASVGL